MIHKARPRFDYSRKPVADFTVFTQSVVNKMTNNIHFQNPVPNLQTIQNAINAFKASTLESINHDTVKIAKRNADRFIVEQHLKTLAGWLMGVTANRDILLTSGMELTNGRGPAVAIGFPRDVTHSFVPGKSGCILLRWKQPAEKRAAMFIIEQASGDVNDDATTWEIIGYSKKCRFLISALTPAKIYSWRICSLGALGAGGKSQPVSSMVI